MNKSRYLTPSEHVFSVTRAGSTCSICNQPLRISTNAVWMSVGRYRHQECSPKGEVMDSPNELRKRADKLERDLKHVRKQRRREARRTELAFDALERVAADKSKGYASVLAAKALLGIE